MSTSLGLAGQSPDKQARLSSVQREQRNLFSHKQRGLTFGGGVPRRMGWKWGALQAGERYVQRSGGWIEHTCFRVCERTRWGQGWGRWKEMRLQRVVGWTFKGPGASYMLDLSCGGWEQKALAWSSNMSRPQLWPGASDCRESWLGWRDSEWGDWERWCRNPDKGQQGLDQHCDGEVAEEGWRWEMLRSRNDRAWECSEKGRSNLDFPSGSYGGCIDQRGHMRRDGFRHTCTHVCLHCWG